MNNLVQDRLTVQDDTRKRERDMFNDDELGNRE